MDQDLTLGRVKVTPIIAMMKIGKKKLLCNELEKSSSEVSRTVTKMRLFLKFKILLTSRIVLRSLFSLLDSSLTSSRLFFT